MNCTRICTLFLSLCIAWLPAVAQPSVVMQAMKDELSRSMNELRLGELEQPYFVSYTVQEVTTIGATASLGGLSRSGESASRTLHVEVRVGDRDLDNTNFYSLPDFTSIEDISFGPALLPLEDDYEELRRAIWLATDRAYKDALGRIAKKRAVLQNETVVEETPDFSIEDPYKHESGPAFPAAEADTVRTLTIGLSALFKEHTDIHVSSVDSRARNVRIQYVNSEGSSFIRDDPTAMVTVRAGTRADDGTEISDSFTAFGRIWADLPGLDELAEQGQALAGRLEALRQAQVFERYAGPVLFEGQAAAELVRQVLVPRLLVQKAPITDDQRTRRVGDRLTNPFQDKLGSRVLPRFLAIVDNPALRQNEQGPLWGGYAVDDEGVPARETVLVQRGMLKTLLATRNPIEGIPQSNGHMRAGGPAPSNLLLRSSSGLTAEEMTEEFLVLLEERDLEYGIVVRRLQEPGAGRFQARRGGRSRGGRLIRAVVAVKVFPDGREELIREAVLTGLSESSFRDIVAASEALTNHTILFRHSSPSFGPFGFAMPSRRSGIMASLAVPSLLFEDVSVRRPPGNIPRPPVVAKPVSGK